MVRTGAAFASPLIFMTTLSSSPEGWIWKNRLEKHIHTSQEGRSDGQETPARVLQSAPVTLKLQINTALENSIKNQMTLMLKINKASSINLTCIFFFWSQIFFYWGITDKKKLRYLKCICHSPLSIVSKGLMGRKATRNYRIIIQWILLIHRFHICKLTYLLKCICSPYINNPRTPEPLQSFTDMRRSPPRPDV